jgi:superfamily II DNA/RNA helicase
VLEAGYHELNRVQMPAVSLLTRSSPLLTKKLAAAACAHAERGSGGGGGGGIGGANGGGASSGVWRRYDVMVCTLLRLVSLLRKGALTLASLEYLVPDKADKLLELGFLEQRDEVLAACDGATV